MATATPLQTDYLFGSSLSQWSGMKSGDVGSPLGDPGAGDRTVQVTGAFGVGTAVQIEGTLDQQTVAGAASNWFPLRDPASNTINMTAAGVRAILENVLALRPHVVSGDGTESLTVTVLTRAPRVG